MEQQKSLDCITIFTYGTLMRGRRNHRLLASAEFCGVCRLEGYALYDLGTYPGIVAMAGGCVLGECYRVPPTALPRLDELEEEGSLYKRVRATVYAQEDNTPIQAETYVYLRGTAGCTLVPSADQPWVQQEAGWDKDIDRLLLEMTRYYAGEPAYIQHFLKVHGFSRLIGRMEGLDELELFTLEAAAVVHDIGIKAALEAYGSCTGPLQEQEGPPLARELLTRLDFPRGVIERVCTLVGRHHTYTGVDGMDCRILLEADFLVNLHESGSGQEAARSACEAIFETETGTMLCKTQFGL